MELVNDGTISVGEPSCWYRSVMKSSLLRSLADDGTTSVEGPAKRCRTEIVYVDVSFTGKIRDEDLNVSEPCR